MYCGACGQENPTENNYCAGCGKPLKAATAIPQQPGNQYSVVLTAAPQYDLDRFFVIRIRGTHDLIPSHGLTARSLSLDRPPQLSFQPLEKGRVALRPAGPQLLFQLACRGGLVRGRQLIALLDL